MGICLAVVVTVLTTVQTILIAMEGCETLPMEREVMKITRISSKTKNVTAAAEQEETRTQVMT